MTYWNERIGSSGVLLQPTFNVGWRFENGWLFAKVLARNRTQLRPWVMNDGTRLTPGSAPSGSAVAEAPEDSASRLVLVPEFEDVAHAVYFGVGPDLARVQIDYPNRVRLGSLRDRSSDTGDVGYIDGVQSPYLDPDPSTELWVFNEPGTGQSGPRFTGFLPAEVRNGTTVRLNFQIYRYRFAPVTDAALMQAMLEGRVPFRAITMGDADFIMKPPSFLNERFGKLMSSTLKMEESLGQLAVSQSGSFVALSSRGPSSPVESKFGRR